MYFHSRFAVGSIVNYKNENYMVVGIKIHSAISGVHELIGWPKIDNQVLYALRHESTLELVVDVLESDLREGRVISAFMIYKAIIGR